MAAARRPPQLLLRRSTVCPVTVPDTQSASQTIWLPCEFNVFLDRTRLGVTGGRGLTACIMYVYLVGQG